MPLPRHQVLIQIVAAVPSRLSLYSDEPMPFSAVEPQHRHSIDFVTLFGRGHCNTVRHGSRNTPDGNAGREPGRRSGAGLGGTSPTPLPLGPDPARHARFNVIHGVGQRCVARTRGPCVRLPSPGRACFLDQSCWRGLRGTAPRVWTRRSLALPCTRGLTARRTPNPGLTLHAARQEDVPRQVDGATSDL